MITAPKQHIVGEAIEHGTIVLEDRGEVRVVTDYFIEGLYQEYLDDTLEPWYLGDIEYMPSTLLREVDPVAYRTGKSDWLDAEEQDWVLISDDSLRSLLEPGMTVTIGEQVFTVE